MIGHMGVVLGERAQGGRVGALGGDTDLRAQGGLHHYCGFMIGHSLGRMGGRVGALGGDTDLRVPVAGKNLFLK